MDLSHQSITGREFELNRRGYDPDTVDSHLADIADAVAEREREIAELKSTIVSLEAKVQDANESEEALRLTLKAAAHAKEELLAGAREQARTMEEEAAAKSEAMVSEATARAAQITAEAEARVKAMEDGARARAGDVARAALAESEALVGRIEGLRENLNSAENALAALQAQSSPQIEEARAALDTALAGAREAAADPAVLASSAPPAEAHIPEEAQPSGHQEAVAAQGPPVPAGADSVPPGAEQAAPQHEFAASEGETPVAGQVEEPAAPAEPEVPVGAQGETGGSPESSPQEAPAPHLEVVGSPESQQSDESSADISDKVDRLLEELREVT